MVHIVNLIRFKNGVYILEEVCFIWVRVSIWCKRSLIFVSWGRYICTGRIQLLVSLNLYGIIEHAQNITLADNPFMQAYIKGENVTKIAMGDLGEVAGLYPPSPAFWSENFTIKAIFGYF